MRYFNRTTGTYLFIFIGFWSISFKGISQNVELEITECNSFKTSHYLEKSEGSLYSVQLEKEVAPNIWALLKKVTTDMPYYIFSNLENGNYRATLVETSMTGENDKIYQKISNEVMINCPLESRAVLNAEVFKIFPNPVNNELFVTTDSPLKQGSQITFEIVNILGQKVGNGRLLSAYEKVDLRKLEAGSYLFLIKDNNALVSTKKLIINKKH